MVVFSIIGLCNFLAVIYFILLSFCFFVNEDVIVVATIEEVS